MNTNDWRNVIVSLIDGVSAHLPRTAPEGISSTLHAFSSKPPTRAQRLRKTTVKASWRATCRARRFFEPRRLSICNHTWQPR